MRRFIKANKSIKKNFLTKLYTTIHIIAKQKKEIRLYEMNQTLDLFVKIKLQQNNLCKTNKWLYI